MTVKSKSGRARRGLSIDTGTRCSRGDEKQIETWGSEEDGGKPLARGPTTTDARPSNMELVEALWPRPVEEKCSIKEGLETSPVQKIPLTK